MYILVSVLGESPASRGFFHSNWVVMDTSGSSGIHLGRRGHIWVSEQRTVGRTDGRTVGIVFLTHIFAQVDAGSMIFESGVLLRVFSDRYCGWLCRRGKRYDCFCVYNDSSPSNAALLQQAVSSRLKEGPNKTKRYTYRLKVGPQNPSGKFTAQKW